MDSRIKVYFGEVLGKHSEIYGPIETSDIELVTSDPSAVKMFLDNDLSTGFNPFDYNSIDYKLEDNPELDLDGLSVGEIVDIILDNE
jgi:hypothetical protein